MRTVAVALVVIVVVAWGAFALLASRKPAGKPAQVGDIAETTMPVKPASLMANEVGNTGPIRYGTFLGDGRRRTYGEGAAPRTLNLIWKVKLGSGATQRKLDNKLISWGGNGWTGQCTVVSDAGRDYLLVGAYDHNLHRIDAQTGKIVWESAWDDVIKGTNTVFVNPHPTGDEDRIIVVAGSRRGSKYAVGDPRIAPFKAVSFATGKELWRFPIPKTPQYSQDVDSSALLVGDTLYVPVEPGYVYALDPSKTQPWTDWRSPVVKYQSPPLWTDADVKAHPDIGGANIAVEASVSRIGSTLYQPSGSGHIYGLRIPDLKIVWDYRTGSDIDGTAAVTREDKLVCTIEKQYISGHGGAIMLDPSKPPEQATVWFFPTPDRGMGEWKGGSVGSAAINDETNKDGSRPALAAFTSVDGNVYVVSQDTMAGNKVPLFDGTGAYPTPVEVFKSNIGGSIGTPLLVGDTLIAAGYANKVYSYRIEFSPAAQGGAGVELPARDGSRWKVRVKQVATFKAGGAFEATPLVWNGRVYIGSRDGYLYCLGDR